MEHKVKVLKKHCQDVGRDFNEITLSIYFHPMLERSAEKMEALAKYLSTIGVSKSEAQESVEMTTGSENIVESVKIVHDIGIRLFILHRFDPARLEEFKKEIIMKL